LRGTISRTGGGYRLDLAALGCASGVELAHARGEAAGQAGVLEALSQAASSLRAQLGESAASVRRYQAPAGTTTAALGALKSYSLGLAVQRDHGDDPSIPDFQRAIQLDPRLAVAYASLAAVYRNLRQPTRALQFATRAYALRARAGGREAFRIATVYFLATGRLDEEMATYRQWAAAYPRDFLPRNDLGNDYAAIGKNREALAEYEAALRLQPSSIGYTNVGGMEVTLYRLGDARSTLEEAVARHFDGLYIRQNLYWLAFLQRNDSLMRQQLDWAAGKPGDEDALLTEESDTEAYYGRLRSAREVTQRAVASAVHAGSKEAAALWQVNAALRDAESGNVDLARREAAASLALSPGRDVTVFAALTLARSGAPGQAQALVRKLERQYPTHALLERFWLPTVEAAIDIDTGHDQSAIKTLEVAAPCESGNGGTFIAYLYPAYVRGDAYLHEHDGRAAAAQFRKLVGEPGIMLNFITGSLMYLQLGRAYGMSGQPARARAAYRSFFALWSGADAGIPVLEQAREEYAKLG
jgi:tetratricopeptide (TPR) repeat protein